MSSKLFNLAKDSENNENSWNFITSKYNAGLKSIQKAEWKLNDICCNFQLHNLFKKSLNIYLLGMSF